LGLLRQVSDQTLVGSQQDLDKEHQHKQLDVPSSLVNPALGMLYLEAMDVEIANQTPSS
jgi:hypothetical protein